MKSKITNPKYKEEGFTCPNCSTYSKHDWKYNYIDEKSGNFCGKSIPISSDCKLEELCICKCEYCGYISFWYKGKLAWPLNSTVEAPIDEMPEDIKKLYLEARSIIELSPKGSCAILRLALQKLCNRLAGQEENKKIDGAIKKLVENGLPSTLQKAMDYVRIMGDEAVHPGVITIDDNKELAVAMFRMINIIIEKMIIEPEEIDELYNLMPECKIKGIENRDKKRNQEEVNS